jgi:membrane protein implicated in regulation of membrane protease activity
MDTDQIFFLFIALAGVTFLGLSFVLGELGDAFDSVGDFIGDNVDLPGGDHDFGGGHGEADGPSPLSLRNLMAFLTAFGASGLITSAYGWDTLQSSLFAIIPGFAMAFIAYRFMKMLYGQEASSVLEVASLVGRTGIVEVGVPQSGLGRVLMNTAGGRSSFIARSEDGSPIASGESVVVKSTLGGDLVVAKAIAAKE